MFTSRRDPDEVGLTVDGEEFRGWQDIEITDSIDAISTVNFNAPFEYEHAEFRRIFRPFTFRRMKVTLGGQALFTGTIVGIHPKGGANGTTVEVNGYALAGVLNDCCSPISTAPHEFRKVGFKAIAQYLVKPFGLTAQLRGDEGARFDRVRIREDEEVLPFLIELAQQRNFVLTNTPDGMLLIWRSVATGNPVANLNGNASPVTNISASFSPQEYFSELTGLANTRRGRSGTRYTAKNTWLPDVVRPKSFKLEDTEKADAREVTMAKMGRMFGNMVSFAVQDIPTWRDPNGNLWAPNTTVLLKAPDVMVYRETEFLVRKVTLRQRADTRTATLELCLPGCFSAEVPKVLPWVE